MITNNSQRSEFKSISLDLDKKLDIEIDTNEILNVAKRSFNCYENGNLCAERCLTLMTNLSYFIKTKLERLDSESCFAALFSSLFPTDERAELDKLLIKSNVEKEKIKSAIRILASTEMNLIKKANIKNSKKDNQLKQVYSKALGKPNSKNKDLDRYNQACAIVSYLSDLREFKSSKTEKIIETLEFALKVYLLQEENSKEINLSILNKIEDLKIGDYLLLPGGYAQLDKGHAILYRIQKTGSEICSITIINTGQGSEYNELTGFCNLFTNRNKVQDLSYKNIDISYITLEFIMSIARQRFDAEIKNPMEAVLKPFKGLIVTEGRTHTAQTKGDCAFKSVSSFIKGELGEEYNKFKVFVTERELKKIESLKKEREDLQSLKRVMERYNLAKDPSSKFKFCEPGLIEKILPNVENALTKRKKKLN